MKHCARCDQDLPLTAFYRDPSRRDGLRPTCRVCILRSQAEKYAANPAPFLAVQHKYRAANLEKTRERSRLYLKSHPERARVATARYRVAHPELRAENEGRRRARRAGAMAERIDMATLEARDGGICGICEQPLGTEKRSIDHILPISEGGAHTYANTRLTHLRCNLQRNNRGAAQLRMIG